MKKLLILLAFIMACNVNIQAQELSEKEYREQYRQTLDSIRVFVTKADIYCSGICNAWNEGIHNNTYKGKKVKDFNEAVTLAQTDMVSLWVKLISKSVKIQKYIKQLNKYPESMQPAFDEILELGIKSDELCRMALEPDGSYNSYSSKSKDLYNEIRKKLYELEMRYTD